jgi:hypothetical protein
VYWDFLVSGKVQDIQKGNEPGFVFPKGAVQHFSLLKGSVPNLIMLAVFLSKLLSFQGGNDTPDL